jgi:hypothetical protein
LALLQNNQIADLNARETLNLNLAFEILELADTELFPAGVKTPTEISARAEAEEDYLVFEVLQINSRHIDISNH